MEWVAVLASQAPMVNTALLIIALYEIMRLRRMVRELEERLAATREELAYIRGRVNAHGSPHPRA